MYRITLLLTVFILLAGSVTITAQEFPWEFKKETDGIKVYTRDIADSNLKALKIILEVEVSINAIMRLLMDTESYPKWVYKCSHTSVIKINSTFDRVDYYQINFPWPLSDRDLYTNTITTIHPETGVITSSSTGVQHGPERDGFIRVPTHFNQWIITPISENKVHIEYFLQSAPGGAIPDWLVNLAADQGPIKSMQGFRKLVKQSPYVDSGEWLIDSTAESANKKED